LSDIPGNLPVILNDMSNFDSERFQLFIVEEEEKVLENNLENNNT